MRERQGIQKTKLESGSLFWTTASPDMQRSRRRFPRPFLRVGAAADHDGGIAPSLDTGAGAIAVSQRYSDGIIARLSPARHLFYQVTACINTKAGVGPGPGSARLRLNGD
jgi:hypothetical protein